MSHDLGYELHALVGVLDGYADALLRRQALSYAQYRVLSLLAQNPGLKGRDVALYLGLTPAAVSKTIQSLRERQLISNDPGASSGNVLHLRATDAGLALFRQTGQPLRLALESLCEEVGVQPDQLAHTVHELVAAALLRGHPDQMAPPPQAPTP